MKRKFKICEYNENGVCHKATVFYADSMVVHDWEENEHGRCREVAFYGVPPTPEPKDKWKEYEYAIREPVKGGLGAFKPSTCWLRKIPRGKP